MCAPGSMCISPGTDLGDKDLRAGSLGYDPRETEAGDGDSQSWVCYGVPLPVGTEPPTHWCPHLRTSLPPQSEAAPGAGEGTMA